VFTLGFTVPVDAIVLPYYSFGTVTSFSLQVFHQIHLPFASQSNIPSDFWEKAKSLGDRVQRYTRDTLHNATTAYPAVAEQINKSKAIAQDVVEAVVQFRNVAVDQMHTTSSLDIDSISDELGRSFDTIIKLLQEEFPSPDQAPNHEERALIVSKVLTDVEEKTVEVLLRHDVNEAHTRSMFNKLRPIIQNLVVLIGDIIEQYPTLLEMLLFSISILVVPEAWILRPVLSLFGFGPYGPIKGSAAAWAQRFFWGAAVKEGSWFSRLQRAAMKFPEIPKVPKEVSCCGRRPVRKLVHNFL